jgi:hypothetical protein
MSSTDQEASPALTGHVAAMQVSPSNAARFSQIRNRPAILAMDALEVIAEVQQKGIEGL